MKVPVPAHIGSIVLVLPLLLAVLQTASAQKNGIQIYSLTVDSKVSSRFAHTVITSRVVNKAEEAQEAIFEMELPKKAFITNFSMIIDGVTYPGNIKEKATAQKQYSEAVARGESAGLVKATGRKMEQFQVSVSVAPAAKVTFELVYEELLKRHLGVYELLLKVRPQQVVKHLQMDIHIFEPQGISFLETESSFMTNELADALIVSQNKTKAHILFKPTLSQQQKSPGQQDTVLDGNFIVRYDVTRTLSGGSIQIENGYFVHYFAPEGLPTMPKNVVFVIDKSGSMSGRKIQQTREALIKILSDLGPKDQFNLITFSSEVTQWKPQLVPASTENVDEAKRYAAGIHASGGTNINEAMLTAVSRLKSDNQAELLSEGSVSLIILLTDGDPTMGETNPRKIQKNVQEAIDGQYSLFCLGFGFDVSYAFLEKMALDNGGLARRIYEDSDSALQLQDFYQEVANPLLTTVAFQYPSNAVEEVTQDNFQLFFKGSEMVVAGKLRDKSPDVLSAIVKGKMHKQNVTFQTKSSVAKQEEEFQSPKYIFHNFMERLWAYLTIQQQLEQMVSASEAESQVLKDRALNLSLEYNFVTPLTSMVVTKPEGQEQSQVAEKPVEDDNRHRNINTGYHLFRQGIGLQGSRMTSNGSGYPRRRGFNKQGIVSNSPQRFGARVADSTERLVQTGPPGDPLYFSHLQNMEDLVFSLPLLPSDPSKSLVHGMEIQNKGPVVTIAPPSAPIQAPPVLLMLPGPSMDRLCVNIKDSQEPMNLLSDPDQGIEVTGQYNTEKACFHWIEVTFKNPQVRVHASPEQVVVTRHRRNSAYKWKETLYSVLPGLKMTMNKTGLLMLSGPDKVTISLLSLDDPGKGLLLLLRDTDHFSSHVNGTLGQFYQDVLWETPEGADDNKRILKVQGKDYSATRELKLDYQEGPPGKEISCWSVEL
ncbi:inter-alpha-trypsin inhibitor heavy chain family member 4 [Ictidomys tridecemlineatus]|uniref:inter-alpha-trypsin inhibitor heavy chain H4 isoform X1 n=1 Tax=Ictidomys tridecemlineatus TaxID=43179 RepID=UPI00038C08DB|nr:inter-alpha-trypsin inhibitor heavy chain H4 isoform X1 [Ictidomys tridecemlineatus]KAG3279334.1 inter-alpha-trypsin inhibitor heavy chain family member 4 [Ictidomys tridecemlineatus]